jgi:YHS domain-containing protein
MDLGAVNAADVAVSILAELVTVRRGRAPFVAMPGPATLVAAAAANAALPLAAPGSLDRPLGDGIILVDPVCGMSVDPADVRHIADHESRTYAFCCAGCRTRFAKNPARYLALA